MLNALRRHANGVVMKVFLSLIVLSFVVWGIGDLFQGRSANSVAQVGGTNITDERYLVTGQFQAAGGEIYGTYSRPAEWYARPGVKF